MDAGSVKPIGSFTVTNVPRSTTAQVPTITPPEKAVTAPAESARQQPTQQQPRQPLPRDLSAQQEAQTHSLKRGYHSDQETGELVFRIEDERTKEVKLQIPTEEILRVKQAYHDSIQVTAEDPAPQLQKTA